MSGMSEETQQHKRRWPVIIAPVLLLIAIIAIFIVRRADGTAGSGGIVEDNRFLLDTVISIRLYESFGGDSLEKAFDMIAGYEGRLSRHRVESEISAINRAPAGVPVAVSEDILELIRLSLDYARRSGGVFDPTVGPLVDLWDIGGSDPNVPSQLDIDAVLPLIDYNRVEVNRDASTVTLAEAGMTLDLGGIAKGWIADRIVDFLTDAGEKHILVNLGGNVMVSGGKPDGEKFRIGMQDPFDDRGSYLGIFSLSDGSIVSSGIYERFFESDGVRYHHILDTVGGYPVDNTLAAVTVLSERSVDGDALSTTLFAMGLEKGLEFASGTDGVEAAFVTREGRIVITEGAADHFEVTKNGTDIEVHPGG